MAERQVNGVLLPDAEPRANGGIGRTAVCSFLEQMTAPHLLSVVEPFVRQIAAVGRKPNFRLHRRNALPK